MGNIIFPTSQDIYIEVNDKKLASAQSYRIRSTKESRPIETFGEAESVGIVGGKIRHFIELKRINVTDAAIRDGISFFDMTNFDVVIVKPQYSIVYSGCEWADITEIAAISDTVLEQVTIIAAQRMESRS